MTVGEFMLMPWHQGWNPVPDLEWMASVADRWAAFPADADPRPVVLVGEPEDVPGFATGEAKTAWMESGAVAEWVVDDPWPYGTDRGRRPLPTRRAVFPDALGPIRRADLSQVDVWSPPGRRRDEHWYSDAEATSVAGNPLTVVWRFWGSPETYTDYPDAEVLETRTAVVVVPRPVERPGTDARHSVAHQREVTLRLRRPVGGRVLLDVYGRAVVLADPLPGS